MLLAIWYTLCIVMGMRRINGQFTKTNYTGAAVLGASILMGVFMSSFNTPEVELVNPYVSHNFHAETTKGGWETATIVPLSQLSERLSPPEPTKTVVKAPVNKDYDELFKAAFGDNWKTARAIAMAEAGMNWAREGIHKAGKYSWSSNTYKGECSIGAFQINLASDACNGKRVHWSKAEGNTLEEKIAWLKKPENNIKLAVQIYKARGNFTAWSTYTNGSYLKYME